MANYVFIATSLDGFIADPEDGIGWLDEIPDPEQGDYGYTEFITRIDAILMGRRTFEKLLTFETWPYEQTIFVLSSSLTHLPEGVKGKAELIQGEPHMLINQLNRRGFKNFYIDGGVTIQRFLQQDLIDEMIITRIPILLGAGIPLFGDLSSPMKFKHKRTVVFNNMLVQSHYFRKR
jgi:dihydrofolate reductase